MRVAAYTRVSTEAQAEHGVSLDAQRASITAYCEAHGLDLAAVYTDAGASAGTLNRPALVDLLVAVDAGELDALIVWKLDRLTRRQRDLLDLIDRFEARGIALKSVSESFDTATPSGRAMFSMLGVFAQLERETLAERTREGMRQAKANGRHTGRTPFGYSRSEKGDLIPDPDAQAVIAMTRTLRAMNLSLREVAAAVNAGGHTTATGRAFSAEAVRQILNRTETESEVAA